LQNSSPDFTKHT